MDHLEQVIDAFLHLKESYELENDSTLSQAPRHYVSEPQQNLTQLFPYPEKNEESSTARQPAPDHSEDRVSSFDDHQAAPLEPVERAAPLEPLERTAPIDRYWTPRDTSTFGNTDTHGNMDALEKIDIDISCFDVDLDSVPAEQAAVLAERMMAAMSIDRIMASQKALQSSTQFPVPQRNDPEQTELLKVKQESIDGHDRPTLPATSPSILEVKPDPDDLLPTQQRPSMESNVVLCGTYLSPQKKSRMETVAKTLKAKVVDDMTTRATHVVMDITREQSRQGKGRTVKYFLGVLRASWVLRYEWIIGSMEAGYWVDEEPYQIYDNEMGINAPKKSRSSQQQGDPPLFSGCEVQLSGVFVKPTKDEVEIMIRSGGGTVVTQLFLGTIRSSRIGRAISRSRSPNDEDNFGTPSRHLILYDQASDGVVSLKKLKTTVEFVQTLAHSLGKKVEVVQCKTLLDCIAEYNIDNLEETIVD
ncbi:hypothetical protein BG011_002533 [Mortierella polycephala]|uniref:BRCT domain-containing protein n=1 Tax=Mortierella polycephala TaxID=41804 RepID=A0A9P6U417_9FUNG|nr:hypothetical protein BG011_002533 [Mortierella polycephala]